MKQWMRLGAAFVLGAACGLAAMALVRKSPAVQPVQGAGAAEQEIIIEDLRGEQMLLQARLNRQQQEIARLQESLREAVAQAAAQPEAEPPAGAEQAAAERGRRWEQRWDERMQAQAEAWASRLGLSEAQRQAVADVYRRQMESLRALRNGESSSLFDVDSAMRQILSPEQFADYIEQSQEEIVARADWIASNQLNRMARSVELSTEQQGKVYETVHVTAQEMMIARQAGEEYDFRAVLEERLGASLTEEQLRAFRESASRGPGRGVPPGP